MNAIRAAGRIVRFRADGSLRAISEPHSHHVCSKFRKHRQTMSLTLEHSVCRWARCDSERAMRIAHKTLLILCLLPIAADVLEAQTAIGTLTYQDQTGAAAPEQNLRFSTLDGSGPIPAGLNYKSNRVLNAAGQQVAWQQMSNGDLMVRTSMPPSKLPFATTALARSGNSLTFSDPLEVGVLAGECRCRIRRDNRRCASFAVAPANGLLRAELHGCVGQLRIHRFQCLQWFGRRVYKQRRRNLLHAIPSIRGFRF